MDEFTGDMRKNATLGFDISGESNTSLLINGLKREYYEGRTKIPFEPAGRQWMAEILPELVRTTTIGAEGRVDRFFKKGGATAVVAEIESMESNYVKSHYANLLMKQPVNTKDYVRIIDRIT